MTKKASRRPVRTKARARRTPPRPASNAAVQQEPVAAPLAGAPTVMARPAAGVVGSSVRRAPPAMRRAPGLTINYAYLRRDIYILAVLAPSMVVLVLIAYFTLR